jgi:hypothetical protein
MKIGQMIILRAYGGEELNRRVVHLYKDIVVVCRSEEYERANKENREPVGVGFHIRDVIAEKP